MTSNLGEASRGNQDITRSGFERAELVFKGDFECHKKNLDSSRSLSAEWLNRQEFCTQIWDNAGQGQQN